MFYIFIRLCIDMMRCVCPHFVSRRWQFKVVGSYLIHRFLISKRTIPIYFGEFKVRDASIDFSDILGPYIAFISVSYDVILSNITSHLASFLKRGWGGGGADLSENLDNLLLVIANLQNPNLCEGTSISVFIMVICLFNFSFAKKKSGGGGGNSFKIIFSIRKNKEKCLMRE